MTRILAIAVVVALAGAPAAAGMKKKAMPPPPKASAGARTSPDECQRYLQHLIDLQAVESVAAVPEAKEMNEKEKAAAVERVKADAAKLPESARELKDCVAGEIHRAEIECTLKATSAQAASKCAGL